MYIEVKEELKNKIEEETGVDYNFKGNMLNILELENLIDDLIADIHFYREKYNELKQELDDNYKPIKQSEQYE